MSSSIHKVYLGSKEKEEEEEEEKKSCTLLSLSEDTWVDEQMIDLGRPCSPAGQDQE